MHTHAGNTTCHHKYCTRYRKRSRRICAQALPSFLQRFSGSKGSAIKERDLIDLGPFKVSPLGLGTWAWGNQLLWGYDKSQDASLQEAFNYATERGISLWDTGDSYGTGLLNGRAEQLLGRFKREFPGTESQRSNIRIATKLAPYPWRVTSQQFSAACRGSLRRLGTDNLAIGQLHWSTANYQPLQERALWDGLVRMYEEGLVQAVGVSNYGPKQMQKIAKYLSDREVPLVTAQVQYSLVSRSPQQQAIRSVCQDLGVQLISYSPLGLGLLTDKYDVEAGRLPAGARALLFKQILPGLRPLITEMRRIAEARKKSVPQVAINWCLCQGTIPIPGAKSVQQVEEVLGALGWRMSASECQALEAAADAAPKAMLQNIFQTK